MKFVVVLALVACLVAHVSAEGTEATESVSMEVDALGSVGTEGALYSSKEEFTALQGKLLSSATGISELLKEIKRSQHAAIVSLRSEMKELRSEVSTYKTKLTKANDKIKKLRTEMSSVHPQLHTKLSAATSRIDKLHTKMTKSNQNKQLTARINSLAAQLKQVRTQCEKSKNALKAQVQKVKASLQSTFQAKLKAVSAKVKDVRNIANAAKASAQPAALESKVSSLLTSGKVNRIRIGKWSIGPEQPGDAYLVFRQVDINKKKGDKRFAMYGDNFVNVENGVSGAALENQVASFLQSGKVNRIRLGKWSLGPEQPGDAYLVFRQTEFNRKMGDKRIAFHGSKYVDVDNAINDAAMEQKMSAYLQSGKLNRLRLGQWSMGPEQPGDAYLVFRQTEFNRKMGDKRIAFHGAKYKDV